MPNFDSWVTIGIDWRCAQESGFFAFTQIQQEYEDYRRERERQDHIHEEILQEQAELAEDKKKYPLFYLKEGIV